MAIATSTALAIGGLAVSAGSAGLSFAQAGKQRRLQSEAQEAANKAILEAQKKLDINYYASLGIQKEPYELERQAMLSAGAQATQAGIESERGAAATAGRIFMGQNEAQAGIRTAMGKELTNLDFLTAEEQSRLRDIGVNLNMSEAQGAQQAAADAQRAAAAATTQGMQSLSSMGQQAISLVPLYSKTKEITTPVEKTAGGGAGAPGQPSNYVAQSSQNPNPTLNLDFIKPNKDFRFYQYPGVDNSAALGGQQGYDAFLNYMNNPFIRK